MSLIEPLFLIKIVSIFTIVLTLFIVFVDQKKWEKYKKIIFLLYVIPIAFVTLYLVGATVHKNFTSQTGGPIHWHADFEVIACGEKLDLVNPRGLKNKIGSPLFHEHDDNRIHVEGTIKNVEDIEVDDFFRVIGGELKKGLLIYDIEGVGKREFRDGEVCSNGKKGYVQLFVNGEKINSFNYLYYPNSLVPPGDCFIVEFGPLKDKTDEICSSWKVQGWNYENYKNKREAIDAYGHHWEGY